MADRYAPLPAAEYKLPFISTIQLPLLQTYHSRVSGSLDAFETLSSAFIRAVPGALSGNTRGGIHVDQSKVTGGLEGLGRLVKADLSAAWILRAMQTWADDIVRSDRAQREMAIFQTNTTALHRALCGIAKLALAPLEDSG